MLLGEEAEAVACPALSPVVAVGQSAVGSQLSPRLLNSRHNSTSFFLLQSRYSKISTPEYTVSLYTSRFAFGSLFRCLQFLCIFFSFFLAWSVSTLMSENKNFVQKIFF